MKCTTEYKEIMEAYDRCNLMIDVIREEEYKSRFDKNTTYNGLEKYKSALIKRLKQLQKDCIEAIARIDNEIKLKQELGCLIGSKILMNQRGEFESLLVSIYQKMNEYNIKKTLEEKVSTTI